MKESDKHTTAFSLGLLGVFENNRLAFELTNACVSFQQLMESCMDELYLPVCLIFLDDVKIFSKRVEQHLEKLEYVFKRLKQQGLKLKGSKWEFFKQEVRYLGYIVFRDNVKTDPGKIVLVLPHIIENS